SKKEIEEGEDLPPILLTLSQTSFAGVRLVIDETYTSHEVFLARQMTRLARALACLYAIKLGRIGLLESRCKACFLSCTALLHSSFHHGTGSLEALVDERGMEACAAAVTVAVK